MKKLMIAAAMTALLPFSAQAQMKYVEGQDYNTLPAVVAAVEQPTVVEFFWFGCSHCNNLYPAFEQWIHEKKPESIAVEKVPAIPSSNWATGAQLYYTAQALGMDMAKVEQAAFDAFHKQNDRGVVIDPKRAQAFLVKQGADAAQVEKTWNSFAVKQKMERARQMFADSGVDGVPSFLVNGRYVTAVQRDYARTFDVLETVALSKPYRDSNAADADKENAAPKSEEAAPAATDGKSS